MVKYIYKLKDNRDLSTAKDFAIHYTEVTVALISQAVLGLCGQCCKSMSRTALWTAVLDLQDFCFTVMKYPDLLGI